MKQQYDSNFDSHTAAETTALSSTRKNKQDRRQRKLDFIIMTIIFSISEKTSFDARCLNNIKVASLLAPVSWGVTASDWFTLTNHHSPCLNQTNSTDE